MKVKPQAAVIIVIAIFIIGIAVTSITGLWKTQTTKVPATIKTGEYAGSYNPADIRGSYTFADISSTFKIPIKDLAAAFGVKEADAAAFKCKDLETMYAGAQFEIGTASVRMFTAYYLGLPYTSTEETYITEAAAKILKEKGKMTKEQLSYLEKHTVPAK